MRTVFKIVFCVIGFFIATSGFSQELSDQQIGLDVAKITQRLQERGLDAPAIEQEIAMNRTMYKQMYIEQQKIQEEILHKVTSKPTKPLDNHRSVTDISPTEKAALQALYNSTSGANWTNTTQNKGKWDFNTNTPVTSWHSINNTGWYGITVENGKVTSIHLTGNNLNGTIPNGISSLFNLQYLSLGSNNLFGTIPTELSQLTNLYYLFLNNNNLSGTIPSSLGTMIKLNYLHLGSNNLLGTIPTELSQLTNLVHLLLYNNNLNGSIPSSLGSIIKLKSLSLGFNNLSGTIPTQISLLINLELLNLYNNSLTGIIPASFSSFTKLNYFLIGFNILEGTIPDISSNLLLQNLNFNNNKFRFNDFINQHLTYKARTISNNGAYYYGLQAKTDAVLAENKSVGQQVTMTMCSDGNFHVGDIFYWFKDGIQISGATSRIYTFTVSLSSAGTYTCKSFHTTNPDIPQLTLEREPITLNVAVNNCAQALPTNLVISNNTGTTCTVAWSAVPNAVSYEVVIVPAHLYTGNQIVPTGYNIVSTTNLSHAFTGLQNNLAYTILVRTVCSEGQKSPWVIINTAVPVACNFIARPLLQQLLKFLVTQTTVSNGNNTIPEFIAFAPYLTDINPGIFDFVNTTTTCGNGDINILKFNWSNHGVSNGQYDVELRYLNNDGDYIGTPLSVGYYSYDNLPTTFVQYVDAPACSNQLSLKHVNFCATSCTFTNQQTANVKQLLMNLVNHLKTVAEVNDGYTCPQLTALQPYLTDLTPTIPVGIYNYGHHAYGVHFSLSPQPLDDGPQEYCGNDLPLNQDVYIHNSGNAAQYATLGNLTSLDVSSFVSPNVYLCYRPCTFENGNSSVSLFIKHIDFCPTGTTSCAQSLPTNLVLTNNTGTSCTVAWSAVPNAVSYEAVIVPAHLYEDNQVVPTGFPIINTTNLSHAFTGLQNNLAYTILVRTVCSEGQKSPWVIINTAVPVACNFIARPLLQQLLKFLVTQTTVSNGNNTIPEFIAFAPYLTDINPGIFDFVNSTTTCGNDDINILKFNWSNHGVFNGQYDVELRYFNYVSVYNYIGTPLSGGYYSYENLPTTFVQYVDAPACSIQLSLKHVNFCATSCTVTNQQTANVKQLFMNLVNHLKTVAEVNDGYTCPQLTALQPYLTDLTPTTPVGIYNYGNIDFFHGVHFSFSPQPLLDGPQEYCGNDLPSNQDVYVDHGGDAAQYATLGNLTSLDVSSFVSPNVYLCYSPCTFENGNSSVSYFIKHIDFCPTAAPCNSFTPTVLLTETTLNNLPYRCGNRQVEFSVIGSPNQIVSYAWTISINSNVIYTSNQNTINYNFTTPGNYKYGLTTTDVNGCIFSLGGLLPVIDCNICNNPITGQIAETGISTINVCGPRTVYFTFNNPSPNYSYEWKFKDLNGTVLSTQSTVTASFYFSNLTSHSIELKVTDIVNTCRTPVVFTSPYTINPCISPCTMTGDIKVSDTSIESDVSNPAYQCGNHTVYLTLSSSEPINPNATVLWTVTNQQGVVVSTSTINSFETIFELTNVGMNTISLTVTYGKCVSTFGPIEVPVIACEIPCDKEIHFNFNFSIASGVTTALPVNLNHIEREEIANGIGNFINNNLNENLIITTYDDYSSGVRTKAVQTHFTEIIGQATTNSSNETQLGTNNPPSNLPGVLRFQDDPYANTFLNIITNPTAGILNNPAIDKKINISFFVFTDDKFSNIVAARNAYNSLLSSGKSDKIFFILMQGGQYVDTSTGVSLTAQEFVAQIKNGTATDFAFTNNVLTSDYIAYPRDQITNTDFMVTLGNFLTVALKDVQKDLCGQNCTKNNPNSVIVNNLFVKLVQRLIALKQSGMTDSDINDIGTLSELSALAPYITDGSAGIYNFSSDLPNTNSIRFSFAPDEDGDDVLFEGWQGPFENYNNYQIDLSTFNDPIDYFTANNNNFNNTIVKGIKIRHINFCPAEIIRCTENNPRTQNVKERFSALITKLFSLNPNTITNGFTCPELIDLSPYITDTPNPAIYNYILDLASGLVRFSFSPHNPKPDIKFPEDVELEVGSSGLANLSGYGAMTNINVSSFASADIFLEHVVIDFENGGIKSNIRHINFCPDPIEYCTTTNPRTNRVKQLFNDLLVHLHKRVINGLPISSDYNCSELDVLSHYITDPNPRIYNFVSEPMSFSFHPTTPDDTVTHDVLVSNWPSDAYASLSNLNVMLYNSPVNFTNLDEKIQFSDGTLSLDAEVRHINFCPDEICVNHISLIVDESGSIDVYEKVKIKRQLKKFLEQQAAANDLYQGNMYISMIGMADRDVSNRSDDIKPTRIDPTNLISKFYPWVESYGNRYDRPILDDGISGGSDFWKSGLDRALDYNIPETKLDMAIMITDGSETNDVVGLKATMAKFNNTSLHYAPANSKPHLYVVGIKNGFYVNANQSNVGLNKTQDPNYVPTLKSASATSRVTSSLALSLKYLLLQPNDPEFPFEQIDDFSKDYFGHIDFSFFGDVLNENYLSNNIKKAGISCRLPGGKDSCDDCFSFQPTPNKWYVLNAWAKEESNVQLQKYDNPKIKLSFYDVLKEPLTLNPSITIGAKGDIIEGWQRIGDKFKVPDGAIYMDIELVNEGNNTPVFFDDIRIYPISGSIKSFVYDPETFKLMSELDENNYATYYEYDNEGGLVRIKKETVKGIKTIQETRSGNVIKVD